MKLCILGKFWMETGANNIPLLHCNYNFSQFAFRIFMFYCSQNRNIFALFSKKLIKNIKLFIFTVSKTAGALIKTPSTFFSKSVSFTSSVKLSTFFFNFKENKKIYLNLRTKIISVGFYIQSSENPFFLSFLYNLSAFWFKYYLN